MSLLSKTLHEKPTPMNDVQLTSLQTEQLLDKLIDSGNEISGKRLAMLCHSAMGLKTKMGLERVMVAMEACKLFDKKQSDYGSRNIDSWGEKNMNILGIGVRVNDKIQRLVNLTKKKIGGGGTPEVEDESLSDTAIDITNYGAILTLLLEDRWK